MNWTLVGGLMGFCAVAAGAFGAHGLKSVITPSRLETFEVAVRYQMYHALALLMAGFLDARAAAWCFLVGTLIFSGSLCPRIGGWEAHLLHSDPRHMERTCGRGSGRSDPGA